MRIGSRISTIVILVMFPLTILAHRLDEYLQATRLDLAVDHIVLKMDLTPGVDVAPLIFALINTNRDGRISENEARAYANQVLKEAILEVDGTRQHLDLVRSQFPSFQGMRAGTGVIRIEARAGWTGAPGGHLLFYRNNHRSDLGAYLVNALVPASREIEITEQHRDPFQREIRLDFKVIKPAVGQRTR
jgi:hypothetical protein